MPEEGEDETTRKGKAKKRADGTDAPAPSEDVPPIELDSESMKRLREDLKRRYH